VKHAGRKPSPWFDPADVLDPDYGKDEPHGDHVPRLVRRLVRVAVINGPGPIIP
jgi:hypothetical protein